LKFLRLKLKRTLRGNLKAVSPVIATIIIVAIAITMSIAVAYWLLGLGSSFTKYEKVEFVTGYTDSIGGKYVAVLDLKNTGSAIATIDPSNILYNGKPASAYGTSVVVYNSTASAAITTPFSMSPGQSTKGLQIQFTPSATGAETAWNSGMTVEITLHTTGGKDYPKVVTLP
jgi:archaeal type IV pilus assembly protein PilA